MNTQNPHMSSYYAKYFGYLTELSLYKYSKKYHLCVVRTVLLTWCLVLCSASKEALCPTSVVTMAGVAFKQEIKKAVLRVIINIPELF